MRSWAKRLYEFFRGTGRPQQFRAQQLTYTEHDFTYGNLNFAAAKRQASIGKHYARHAQSEQELRDLKQGTITLPPHKPWTGDYTDWTADPFSDLNWRFQFHTLRWINPLLWAALDRDEEAKAEWKRIVRSWSEANIPPENAEDKYAWMDMTDGNRAIQVSLGAPLMDSSDHWYVDCLATHRNWLLDDDNIVPGNHGLHQNLGLFVVASVLDDDKGVLRAIERLGAQILDAFDSEGLNEEGSVAYHQHNLVWWLEARERLQLEGYDFSQEALDRLDKAGEAMGYLLLPDKTMPQIGDGGRGMGRRGIHPLVDEVLSQDIQDKSLPLFRTFPNGMAVSRSGWGQDKPLRHESHTIVRYGPDLERHSHNDRGSVHIYTLGRRWITDGGFHSYQHRNSDRNYTKSRSAHNLVNLPEQKHDKTGDVPALLVQHDEDLHVVEVVDENFEAARWLRRVMYLPAPNCWVIWDRIETDTPQKIRQQWLMDIGIEVTQNDTTSLQLTDSKRQLGMRWFGDQPTFDIVNGDRKTKSKRGLIGIRWKRMKEGTSVHANFMADEAESVVVIAPGLNQDLNVSLTKRSEMHSFELAIRSPQNFYDLEVGADHTRLHKHKP
ncbi:heparinase II/III domain-containing protein [Enteractinococcus coprophilus]|uniref:Heparinase II/III-like protein n=1 Tax=Enteractinococcus coprophilus TaxID=1027633 RepID=A0A543AIM5_9MICC|nr:heparinase II/III family protein [Enteractinococcus coprophilus]TQL72423.1 heparinase II/III-like protein [Enteractinococcus coprophilus]